MSQGQQFILPISHPAQHPQRTLPGSAPPRCGSRLGAAGSRLGSAPPHQDAAPREQQKRNGKGPRPLRDSFSKATRYRERKEGELKRLVRFAFRGSNAALRQQRLGHRSPLLRGMCPRLPQNPNCPYFPQVKPPSHSGQPHIMPTNPIRVGEV